MDHVQDGIRTSHKLLHKTISTLYSIIKSWFGLLILLIIYSVIGAIIFMKIEGPPEKKRRANLIRERLRVGDLLWNLTQNYVGDPQSYDNWTQYVQEELPRYEDYIYTAYRHSFSSKHEVWDFYGALLYCGTIYTTIGTYMGVLTSESVRANLKKKKRKKIILFYLLKLISIFYL